MKELLDQMLAAGEITQDAYDKISGAQTNGEPIHVQPPPPPPPPKP